MYPRRSFLLVAIAASVGARAQDIEVAESEPFEVVGALEPERDPRAPTAARTHIELADRPEGSLDLSSALSEVPAVVLHRYGSPGSLVTFSLRGSASNQVRVELGTLPMTPPGGGLVDLSGISPALLDSLVVLRGGAAANFGAGALGGVLQLRTLSTGRPAGWRIDSGLGSFGSWSASLRGQQRTGPVSFAGGAAFRASNGEFRYDRDLTPALQSDPWDERVPRANNGSVGLSSLVSVRADTEGGTWTGTAFGHQGRREVPGFSGFPTPGAFSRQTRSLAGGTYETRPTGAHLLRFRTTAWAGHDQFSYDPGAAPSPSAGPAGRTLRWVVGARSGASALVGNQFLGLMLEGTSEWFESSGQVQRSSLSLTARDTLWSFSDRLQLSAALRVDAFTDGAIGISPNLGALVVILPGLEVFANAGRGVRRPTLYELHAQNGLILSNPDLEPESAVTADLGLSYRHEHGQARAALYYARYQNLITYELYPPLRVRPFNFRDARVTGLEVEGTLRPGSFLEVRGMYGYTDAVNLRPDPNELGKQLPYRPRHRGLVRLAAKFDGFELFVAADAQSRFPRNRANTKTLRERVLISAGGRVQVGGGLSVAIDGQNLLDDRRLEDVFGYPLPGRSIFVSARLKLAQGANP